MNYTVKYWAVLVYASIVFYGYKSKLVPPLFQWILCFIYLFSAAWLFLHDFVFVNKTKIKEISVSTSPQSIWTMPNIIKYLFFQTFYFNNTN
jgi:hypothetical protein